MSQFYAGRTLFLTGGSGFLGKQLIEKVLRSCPAVDQIMVLIRSKKNKNPEERLDQLFDSKVFDRLKVEQPNYRSKITAVAGDILLPGLGINDKDRAKIESQASVFIHSAASLNFTEPLRNAVETNILPTRKMLQLAKSSKLCEAFIHVSTAYSQVDKKVIDEVIYDPPIDPYRLFKLIEVCDDEQLALLTPKLLAPRPNTYTFTKAVAEKLVDLEREQVPVAVVRPSIITAAHEQPFDGWVDNYSACTGIIAASTIGTVRHMYGREDLLLDFIPIDMSCHAVLAAARHIALNKKQDTPFVLNCNSTTLNPFLLRKVCEIVTKNARKDGSTKYLGFGRPLLYIGNKKLARDYNVKISLPIKAKVLDTMARMTGQKPRVSRMQEKFTLLQEVLEYFCLNEFHWKNRNYDVLLSGLPQRDREDFNFDVRTIDWPTYHRNYWYGIRRYLLQENIVKPEHRNQTSHTPDLTPRPAINYSTK